MPGSQKNTKIHTQRLFNAIEIEVNVAGELVVLENLAILAAVRSNDLLINLMTVVVDDGAQ